MEIFLVNDKKIEPQLLIREGTPPLLFPELMLSEEFPGYQRGIQLHRNHYQLRRVTKVTRNINNGS